MRCRSTVFFAGMLLLWLSGLPGASIHARPQDATRGSGGVEIRYLHKEVSLGCFLLDFTDGAYDFQTYVSSDGKIAIMYYNAAGKRPLRWVPWQSKEQTFVPDGEQVFLHGVPARLEDVPAFQKARRYVKVILADIAAEKQKAKEQKSK